jgi:ankyrin repeat protein
MWWNIGCESSNLRKSGKIAILEVNLGRIKLWVVPWAHHHSFPTKSRTTAIMSVDPQTQRLFDAIAVANYSQVKRAIEAGVAIDRPNALGQTPLAMACQLGNREIIDLLVAAGGRMQAEREIPPSAPDPTTAFTPHLSPSERLRQYQQGATLPIPTADSQGVARDISLDRVATERPTAADSREVAYDNLIELIHQPASDSATEIDESLQLPLPIDLVADSKPLPAPISAHNPTQIAPQWTELTSDPETTYTFDLDAVFAERDSELTAEREIAANSPPVTPLSLEASETYAFDLGADFELLTTAAAANSTSRSTAEWSEEETYAIGLEEVDGLSLVLKPESDRVVDVSRLLLTDEDRFIPVDTYEDGETYAIDLDDLASYELVDGQTAVRVERHLLAEIDSSLFPAIAGEDGDNRPDFDPDTQTSTDIFGQSKEDSGDLTTEDTTEHSTNTSLMAAIIEGDLELAQQAISSGANLDRYDWQMGYSPLGMAIDRGHIEIARCLLGAGANAHYGSTTSTALGLAAERGEAEIVQLLLPRGIDVNEPVGQDNWTALLSAIAHGHKSVVQLLVTAGANVNIWSQGETPILLAAKREEREIYNYLYPLVSNSIRLCADRDGERLLQSTRKRRIREQNRPIEKFVGMAMEGNNAEVARAIEIGIEIDELGAGGHTALMAAAYYGHRSVVKMLLEAGANPNLLSDDDGLGSGMTALMLTAGSFFANNRQSIAKLLLANGADVNQQGVGGKTAISCAALAGVGYRECVEVLIAAGADLDLRDDRGHTVLTMVAAAENYQMLNLLIQAGASTAGLDSIQLIQAASNGNLDRVRSLLSGKVNLDLDRGAAIGKAAAAGHTEIVELLIRAGANVNLSDRSGFTPIASAAYAGYGDIVRLLVDAGADIQAPASESHSYSPLEYARMGLYQFDREDRQHAAIVRLLEQLEQM